MRLLIIDNCKQCHPRPLDCGVYLVCQRKDNKYVIPSEGIIPEWCPLKIVSGKKSKCSG